MIEVLNEDIGLANIDTVGVKVFHRVIRVKLPYTFVIEQTIIFVNGIESIANTVRQYTIIRNVLLNVVLRVIVLIV